MKIDINFEEQSNKNYTVYVDELDKLELSGKVAIITNPRISSLHLQFIKEKIKADELHVISIPDGERYKSLTTIESILKQLFELKFNRNSTLIAFGGGVIGDITGFCASIYQRGIPYIQIPTTLLAQVDSSVGGKTGVNNEFGKNLVGTFWQPQAVYCETSLLDTLPEREFNSGLSEVIKMAIVYDKEMFNWIESLDLSGGLGGLVLGKLIAKSVALKASVITKDEKEEGLRKVLNYGHTFAHVIEKQTNYQTFLHGEAIAIGMNMANQLAMDLGLLDMVENERICELLQRYSLPTEYTVSDVRKFYAEFSFDKKGNDYNVTFVLPNHIGGYIFKDDVDKNVILQNLRKFS